MASESLGKRVFKRPKELEQYSGLNSVYRQQEVHYLAAKHLSNFRTADTATFALIWGVTIGTAENTVRRMVRQGYLKRYRVGNCPMMVLLATPLMADFWVRSRGPDDTLTPMFVDRGDTASTMVVHNLIAGRYAALYARKTKLKIREMVPAHRIVAWCRENGLSLRPELDLSLKLPDVLIVLQDGRRIAIEIEQTDKAEATRNRIFSQYARLISLGAFSHCIYVSTRASVMRLYEQTWTGGIYYWVHDREKDEWRPHTTLIERDGKMVRTPNILTRSPGIMDSVSFVLIPEWDASYYPAWERVRPISEFVAKKGGAA